MKQLHLLFVKGNPFDQPAVEEGKNCNKILNNEN